MKYSAKEISEIVGGRLVGNGEIIIDRISPIDEAKEGSVSFLHLSKYNRYLYSTKASVVLVHVSFIPENNNHPALIYVNDVQSSYTRLLELFNHVQGNDKSGIDEPVYISTDVDLGMNIYIGAFTYIGKGAKIGNNVKIYPQVYVGENVAIGDNTIVYSGVKIYYNCKIGKNCILHSGSVIGSDGFGFVLQEDGKYKKTPQVGNVILRDYVEIGSNTTIDRATLESTIINEGVKLDNLVMIAHNVEIGENTVIAAQSGISGSTKIGKRCVFGGQVGVVGHVHIADGTQIGAKSGVSKSIEEPNKKWFGVPLLPLNENLRLQIILKKLPELYRDIINKIG